MRERKRSPTGFIHLPISDKMYDALDARLDEDLTLIEKFNDSPLLYSTQIQRILVKALSETEVHK